MGGQIALTYAARYPTEVISLWVLDPAGVWSAPKGEMMTIVEKGGRNPLLIKSEDDFAQVIKFLMTKPPFMPRPMRIANGRLRAVAEKIRTQRLTAIDPLLRRGHRWAWSEQCLGRPAAAM